MLLRPMLLTLCLAAPFCATPALADFEQTLSDHILPGYAAFAASTQALAEAAAKDCKADGLKPAFNTAYDAWLGVQHLHFGPAEADGLSVAIAFWPDPKGSGAKAQRALLLGDPAQLSPEHFPDQSVAARGLTGLERLLYPAEPLPADPCALIQATTLDLARMAKLINESWINSYAKTVLTAGDLGNTSFQTRPEVRQTLFTQVVAALEFDKDQRLGRPLGTFDKPRPERAEALASGRSQRNVLLSLQTLRAMVVTLTSDAPLTLAGFDRAIKLAKTLDDPAFAGVATPQGHLKVEILQQAVSALTDTVVSELGPELDVGVGFNAADGD